MRTLGLALAVALSVLAGMLPAADAVREFVAAQMPTPSCHASTVVELRNGDVLAAWFGGTKEGADNVRIWMARRTAKGWSAVEEAAREPGAATYNPVLFYSGDGVLWLYYKFGHSPGTWSAARKFSRDDGVTWSAVEHLPAGLYGPIRAKPLLLPDGTILSGSSVESYESWAAWVERSTDNGRTWNRIGPIAGPRGQRMVAQGEPHGIIQPVLVNLGRHHIRLYARSTSDIGRICTADSQDDGRNWGPAQTTDLPNPNAGIDALRLQDGRLAMVFNDSTTKRTPLRLAVSANGGSWRKVNVLEDGAGEYSYPALVQARNGDLLMTYTWRREKIRFVRLPLEQIR